ncbi:S1C family serine protease [Streptomyces sp. NPDC004646]
MDASRTRTLGRVAAPAAVLVCSAVLGSGCSAPVTAPAEPSAARAAVPEVSNQLQDQYQRVIKEALPSVVQIQASRDLGSGVVFDTQGHIVTNAHVVGSEKTFKVTTASSEDQLTASLVYSYPDQDLAVIKLDRVPAGLKPAVFADSAKVQVGQIVLAMGSPFGLSSSVTQGIVSATGRTVSEGDEGGGTGATIANMVQTSAAINPGNSGGALVNLDGQVVGIPTLGAADPGTGGGAAPGIGFAIPSSLVRTVAGQIVEHGKVTDSGRAALGISARTVVDDSYRPVGAAIVTVTPSGPAAQAGLRTGDVITRLDTTTITSVTALTEALAADKPGQRVKVTYQRNGREGTTEVTLGEQ